MQNDPRRYDCSEITVMTVYNMAVDKMIVNKMAIYEIAKHKTTDYRKIIVEMTMNKLSVDKMTFLMTGDKMVVDMMSRDEIIMYKTFVGKMTTDAMYRKRYIL